MKKFFRAKLVIRKVYMINYNTLQKAQIYILILHEFSITKRNMGEKFEEMWGKDISRLKSKTLSKHDQIGNLISFINSFKDYINYSSMSDLASFVLARMISKNCEERATIADIYNAIQCIEEEEKTKVELSENTEAFLGATSNNGLELLKSVLADIENVLLNEKQGPIKQLYRKPSFFSMANTKLSNFLFDNEYDFTRPSRLVVSEKKKKEVLVSAQIFLSIRDENGLKVPQNITAYDKAVHDGLCSVLTQNKNMIATSRQIYEAMAGKTTTNRQAIEHVIHSLNKMSMTKIYLDYSQQAKNKGLSFDRMTFEGNLLYFIGVEVETNGQISKGYKFLTTPILYEYAANIGQIITVNKSLLNIPNVANTDDSVVLRHYLLRRIQTMKNQRNCVNQNKIKFDSMFSYCSISNSGQQLSRTQLNRKRRIVYDTLQAWVNMKYIKGYTEYRDGRKILGVEIKL